MFSRHNAAATSTCVPHTHMIPVPVCHSQRILKRSQTFNEILVVWKQFVKCIHLCCILDRHVRIPWIKSRCRASPRQSPSCSVAQQAPRPRSTRYGVLRYINTRINTNRDVLDGSGIEIKLKQSQCSIPGVIVVGFVTLQHVQRKSSLAECRVATIEGK